ncbi:MAG: hypothetical protein U1F22_02720 [Lysobacterales bacterium]
MPNHEDMPPIEPDPERRGHGVFLKEKVAQARGQIASGRYASAEEVEARFAARRAELRTLVGDGGR